MGMITFGHIRLARHHRRGLHVHGGPRGQPGHRGVLPVPGPARRRARRGDRLRHPVPLGGVCGAGGTDPGGTGDPGAAVRAGYADAGGRLRDSAAAGGRRDHRHRRPPSSGVQRHQVLGGLGWAGARPRPLGRSRSGPTPCSSSRASAEIAVGRGGGAGSDRADRSPATRIWSGCGAWCDLETIREARLKVVVDPLYGSGRGYLDALLAEAGCEVRVLHDWRDPNFGGRSPEPSDDAPARSWPSRWWRPRPIWAWPRTGSGPVRPGGRGRELPGAELFPRAPLAPPGAGRAAGPAAWRDRWRPAT